MQVQIKFRRTGSNSVYGSFATGDIIRCDQALAEHYIREGVAVYLPASNLEDKTITTEDETARKRKKQSKKLT